MNIESTGTFAFKSKAWIAWLFGGFWVLGLLLLNDPARSATLGQAEEQLTRGWGPDVHLLSEEGTLERAHRCASPPISADKARQIAVSIGRTTRSTKNSVTGDATAESLGVGGRAIGSSGDQGLPASSAGGDGKGQHGFGTGDAGDAPTPAPAPQPNSPAPSAEVRIRVAFHIITDGDQGFVADDRVWKQIDVLNNSYRSVGVDFEVERIARVNNPAWFAGCMGKEETDMKKALAVDPRAVLNVYVCGSSQYLGMAYLPQDYPAKSVMHGATVRHTTLPGGSAAPFNLGDTLVHEVGHYLGLYHTFEYGCGLNDYIVDTPAEREPAYGCPVARDTCAGGGLDAIDNFMNYTDDACMNQFTPGQGEWMLDMVSSYKPEL